MTEVEIIAPARPVAGLISHCGTTLVGRQDLLQLATPGFLGAATAAHAEA